MYINCHCDLCFKKYPEANAELQQNLGLSVQGHHMQISQKLLTDEADINKK